MVSAVNSGRNVLSAVDDEVVWYQQLIEDEVLWYQQ